MIQDGEISEARKAPTVPGDNGLYLLVTRVMRLQSRWQGKEIGDLHHKYSRLKTGEIAPQSKVKNQRNSILQS